MKNVTSVLAISLAFATIGFAQTAKPKPKPAQERVVKGTVQMAGDNGKLNVTYTIGKVDPINITLTDVRYSVIREVVGNDVVAPSKEEKLLVIDFVAHNPNPKAISFSGAMLKFTGVDQESVNREHRGNFTRAKTGEIFYAELKPAQKVELRTVIVVPAAGTVPKLILEHRTGGPVLRYDIKPNLKPLPAIFADPKDETGMTAAEIYNCPPDTYFPMAQIDIKLVPGSVATHGHKFGPNTTGDGRIHASVKLTMKGQHPQSAFFRFQAELIDEDGEKYPVVKWAPVSSEEHVNRRLEIGEEYTMRFVAVISEKAKLKTLKVMDTSFGKPSRTYVFALGSAN
jgi:hypothetical protein